MPVSYRPMHPDEEDAALNLWMHVLEATADEALLTFRDFRDNPQRFDQSVVAVMDDGTLLATVCYWLREIRDTTGQPSQIAHLYHVATDPDARRQGYASQLLDQTIQALQAADCTWAILGARQAAVTLYANAGWQAVPRTYWRGSYDGALCSRGQRYAVQLYDPRREPHGWQPLARVYAAANAHRPGSLVRDMVYWLGYAAWMFGLYLDVYGAALLAAVDGTQTDAIRGYALVDFSDMGFEVVELVTFPDDPTALSSLLAGIIAEATQRQIPLRGQVMMPNEPHTAIVLQQFFGATLHSVDDLALYGYSPFMVRPIMAAMTDHTPHNPVNAPGSLFWPLDLY